MAEVMIMVLKVDLECHKCYRKIKKLLCKYPEIRDQTYNEKKDEVIIKVVCCNPERIRQKLICKSGKTIKSIEIRLPEKPKPLAPEKPKSPPEPDRSIKDENEKRKREEAESKKKPAAEIKPKETDQKPKSLVPTPAKTPVTGYPPMYPIGVCCKQCFDGRWGGPCHCHHGYGIPYRQPPSSYDGYVRLTPSYDGWPSGCRCDRSYGCRCEFYTENYPPCTIM